MNVCIHCGFHNHSGRVACESCKRSIRDSRETMTVMVNRDTLRARVAHRKPATARLDQHKKLVIQLHNGLTPFTLEVTGQIILGRDGGGRSSRKPDIDLEPYGAFANGVSRIHAAICRLDDTLTLVDLGSANGTYLNRKRLQPGSPRILHNGDEISLGALAATIRFAEAATAAAD